MKFLRHLPIKRKLTLIIMLTSCVVLVLACLALATYEQQNIRQRLVNDLATTAAMTGVNSTAGLAFNDSAAIRQTLQSLATQPRIIQACIYGKDRRLLAQYLRFPESQRLSIPAAQRDGHRFTEASLELFQTISLESEKIGTIFLEADLREIRESRWHYVNVMAVLIVAGSFVSLLVAARLQRIISQPIADLARTAAHVATQHDYSVRVHKQSDDELGKLMDGFNHMLAQIQSQDVALQKSHLELEQRVRERTLQLADSLSLTRATLESTADGILVADGLGKATGFNENFLKIWKIPTELGRAGNEAAMIEIAMSQLLHPELFLNKVQELYNNPQAESFDVLEFKDGRLFERYSKPQRLGDKCVGRVWSFRDVTERRRAEATLRRTEEVYRRAITSAGAVPYGFDFKSRRYEFIGDGIQDLIGYAPHELSGDFWKTIIQKSVMLGETAGLTKEAAAVAVRRGEIRHWHCDMLVTARDGGARWISDISVLNIDEAGRPVGSMGMLQDITERKNAEAELARTHRELLETSRQAGMAEVATSVLHNVGNVLNSVNIAASCVADTLRKSKAANLAKVVALLREHEHDLGGFITSDPKGKQVTGYLGQLSDHLAGEQVTALRELDEVQKHIDHIKHIVAMQQNFAKVSGVAESVVVGDLLEDALQINESVVSRHEITVVKEYGETRPVTVEKHKLLQILINLVRNAKQACSTVDRDDRQMTLRVSFISGSQKSEVRIQNPEDGIPHPESRISNPESDLPSPISHLQSGAERVQITVADNGAGIAPENLTRIFGHGFTTKKDGHGFGLHSGALAAKELGGALSVRSQGVGHGAVFTLEFPIAPHSTS